ncbi:MAG TPA: hexose kinase [Candidatus Limnocylindrales bacterium]|nr:hexose kinase [Candidatus Limnocylindrales bacterium]
MAQARIVFVAANPSIDRLYEVDRLTVGAIHRPVALVAVPGGKGLNAARAAARLGGRVTALGILAGRSGDWIEEAISGRRIDARWVRDGGETRTCVSILDRSSGAMTEIYERGEPVDPAAWEALERLVADELARGDVAALAVSGSLPVGAPPDGFGRIAGLARTADPGARPVAVLADTYGPALAAVLAERPALVKINAEEAAEATGIVVTDASSAETAAAVLLDRGAAGVVVTLGPAGAVVVTAVSSNRLVPDGVRGAYPVGSGDAFLGGLAVGLARGDDALEAARLGLAAGTANALVPGAGELDPLEVDRILRGTPRRTPGPTG